MPVNAEFPQTIGVSVKERQRTSPTDMSSLCQGLQKGCSCRIYLTKSFHDSRYGGFKKFRVLSWIQIVVIVVYRGFYLGCPVCGALSTIPTSSPPYTVRFRRSHVRIAREDIDIFNGSIVSDLILKRVAEFIYQLLE